MIFKTTVSIIYPFLKVEKIRNTEKISYEIDIHDIDYIKVDKFILKIKLFTGIQ